MMLILMQFACSSDEGDQQQEEQLEQDQQEDEEYEQEGEEGLEDLQEIGGDISDQTNIGESTGDYNDANALNNINDLGDGLNELESNSLSNNQILSDEALGNDLQGAYDANSLGGNAVVSPSVGDAPSDNSDRVVRYVTSDGTPVYDRPDSSAASLSTLFQGDPLVVAIQGEWAEITSGRYVMTSSLSEKIVPRLKGESSWNPPSGPQP
ncbi:MAG: hypothetical protein HRU09_01710 [Oligoflexales bacterium]|nr:hypothetical protein [Oligoflexales bacterium]